MVTADRLKQLQSMPLEAKIALTQKRIYDFLVAVNGKAYLANSGGLGSSINEAIIRSVDSSIPSVFVDTGLEHLGNKQVIAETKNTITIRPKMLFTEVLDKHGIPMISKKVAMGFDRHRKTKSDLQKELRLYGGINPTSGKKQHPTIPKKWHFLLDAPFKISERCCDCLKKEPFRRYERETGNVPFIGTQASESQQRKLEYFKQGCNSFDGKKARSTPLAFWTQEDLWKYIHKYNIKYSIAYDQGETHTGCEFCLFGLHMETRPDRYDRMKVYNPNRFNFCMNKLDYKFIIKHWIGREY